MKILLPILAIVTVGIISLKHVTVKERNIEPATQDGLYTVAVDSMTYDPLLASNMNPFGIAKVVPKTCNLKKSVAEDLMKVIEKQSLIIRACQINITDKPNYATFSKMYDYDFRNFDGDYDVFSTGKVVEVERSDKNFNTLDRNRYYVFKNKMKPDDVVEKLMNSQGFEVSKSNPWRYYHK